MLSRVKEDKANTLFAMYEGAWETLESVTISGKTYSFVQHQECTHDLILCNSTFTIKSSMYDVNLACRPIEEELFHKANCCMSTSWPSQACRATKTMS